jgi:hypothetical protein
MAGTLKMEQHVIHASATHEHLDPPRTNTLGERVWTMVELRDEVDRFAAMLTAENKRHSTIAAYVTQAERFLNWLEGTYKPRTQRLGKPYGWAVSESRSKYAPLRQHLKDDPRNLVAMTFREVERVLGFQLPASARSYRHWWANDRTGNHTQAYAWMGAGRKVVSLDLIERRVKFIRADRNLRPDAVRLFG